jgi:hypothetical protein
MKTRYKSKTAAVLLTALIAASTQLATPTRAVDTNLLTGLVAS